jgi:NAD(P)-dependent dehydrogenase (short-subunit alcohol dehydrogenase family)
MKAVQGDGSNFEGRRALVVGGSGGIGRAVSLELGARGARVIVHGGTSRARLDSTVAELAAIGAEAEGFLLDLDAATGLAPLSEAMPALGDIDILVVAFGPFLRKSVAATSRDDWERIAMLDFALPGMLCSACLPAMAARGWGRILLFGGSRTDGIRSYSSNAAYAAAKTGLAVLAKSVAVEGSPNGVGCVLVCPGFVGTEYLSDQEKEALRSRSPRGRLATPSEIASAAVGLIAAEPCIASGAVVSLDGGLAF